MGSVRIGESWENLIGVESRTYTCGFCGETVASDRGWRTQQGPTGLRRGDVRVCPVCSHATFFRNGDEALQAPGPRVGTAIAHLPLDVGKLYDEARDAMAVNACTACVLALRKLLMHVAVEKGAKEGLSFLEYVEYLDAERYLGRDGKGWVDLIRSRGNEANHQIVLMSEEDAKRLLVLAEMLLKLVYEFPGKLPTTTNP